MPTLAKFDISSPSAGVWFAGIDRPLLAGHHDSDFKFIVSGGWCVMSEGDVESTVGYVSVVEIPAHDGERDEMMKACFDGTGPDHPMQPGWYVTRENDQGLIWVYQMISEGDAKTAYRRMVAEYYRWATCTEDEPCDDHHLERL